MNILDSMQDEGLFGPWFSGASWGGWRAVLKGAFALPMTRAERKFFRSVSDRDPPSRRARELWIIAGRRSGKDSVASLIAAHAASFFDQQDRLRRGERAVVMCLACDRDQAKIVLGYTRSYFRDVPYLARMVTRETPSGVELDNGVDIAVATNDFRAVRGRAVALAVLDEVAYWRDERSASPDVETYAALKPGTVTLPGAMVVGISSPYRKAGLLHEKWRDHYGRDGDVLVIRAPSIALNPTLDRGLIAEELARDPAVGRAEWLAEWRDDISNFLDRALIEAAVDRGVTVRPRVPGCQYHGFCDPSGGVGDAFTLGIAHREQDNTVVLDCLVERPAPFNPSEVTAEMAKTLREYGLSEVKGDRYGAQWVVQAFAACGVGYRHSARDRSAIYQDTLPLFTSGRARLLDHRKLVLQFAALERRTTATRDRVDHPVSGHDDLCNAVAGALVAAADRREESGALPIFVSAGPGAGIGCADPFSHPDALPFGPGDWSNNNGPLR